MVPKTVRPSAEMEAVGYCENWVCWRDPVMIAKECKLLPGRTVTIKEQGAYGMIVLQGHREMNGGPKLIMSGEGPDGVD